MGKISVEIRTRKSIWLLLATLAFIGFIMLIFQPVIQSNKIALITTVFVALALIPIICFIWDPSSLKWMPQNRQRIRYWTRDCGQVPEDEVCVICLCLVCEDKHGKSICCGNYFHIDCIQQYYHHSKRNTCCLCQEEVAV